MLNTTVILSEVAHFIIIIIFFRFDLAGTMLKCFVSFSFHCDVYILLGVRPNPIQREQKLILESIEMSPCPNVPGTAEKDAYRGGGWRPVFEITTLAGMYLRWQREQRDVWWLAIRISA